jgi:alcohol dehydrogenase (cytochrome c)
MANRAAIAEQAGGNLGVINAVNAVTGKTEWQYRQRAGMQSLMTTGGGLLFAGDSHGRFRAMDQRTGEILWEVMLGSPVTGYPATFEVDGHQYVAVSTGAWLADSFTPELIHGRQNTLYVFALPEAGIGHPGPVRAPLNSAGALTSGDAAQRPAAPARKVSDGVFSAAQALAGSRVYRDRCAACHGAEFAPAQGVPAVQGAAFLANWRGRTLAELFSLMRTTMPPGAAGTMAEADHLAVLAYILQANGFEPGGPLSADPAGLGQIGFGD